MCRNPRVEAGGVPSAGSTSQTDFFRSGRSRTISVQQSATGRHARVIYRGERTMARRSVNTLALAAVFALALLPSTSAYPETLQAVANPEQLAFDAVRLQRLGHVFQGYVDIKKLPGAVILIA